MIATTEYYCLCIQSWLSSFYLMFNLFISNETCGITGSEQPNRTLSSSTMEYLKQQQKIMNRNLINQNSLQELLSFFPL